MTERFSKPSQVGNADSKDQPKEGEHSSPSSPSRPDLTQTLHGNSHIHPLGSQPGLQAFAKAGLIWGKQTKAERELQDIAEDIKDKDIKNLAHLMSKSSTSFINIMGDDFKLSNDHQTVEPQFSDKSTSHSNETIVESSQIYGIETINNRSYSDSGRTSSRSDAHSLRETPIRIESNNDIRSHPDPDWEKIRDSEQFGNIQSKVHQELEQEAYNSIKTALNNLPLGTYTTARHRAKEILETAKKSKNEDFQATVPDRMKLYDSLIILYNQRHENDAPYPTMDLTPNQVIKSVKDAYNSALKLGTKDTNIVKIIQLIRKDPSLSSLL